MFVFTVTVGIMVRAWSPASLDSQSRLPGWQGMHVSQHDAALLLSAGRSIGGEVDVTTSQIVQDAMDSLDRSVSAAFADAQPAAKQSSATSEKVRDWQDMLLELCGH